MRIRDVNGCKKITFHLQTLSKNYDSTKMHRRSLIYLILGVVLSQTTGCVVLPPAVIKIDLPNPPPPPPLRHQPQVALVLGSGMARGPAEAGVIKALEDASVPVDLIVSSSIGSIVGLTYAAQPDGSELVRKAKNVKSQVMMKLSFGSLLAGHMANNKIGDFIAQQTHNATFNQLAIRSAVVATDLNTGKIVVLQSGSVAAAAMASCAHPIITRPVELYGRTLIDGAVSDAVPIDIAMQFHPKLIIGVDISGPLAKDSNKPSLWLTHVARLTDQIWSITASHLRGYQVAGADVMIFPNSDRYESIFIKENAAVIESGEAATKKALPIIKALMKQRGIKPGRPGHTPRV